MLGKPKEKVYVIETVGTGEKVLFEAAGKAAEHIGVSVQHMQRCRRTGRVCDGYRVTGWRKRSYLVGTKVGTFELCNVENGGFRVVGKGGWIRFEDARVVKDATDLCMNGESL